MQETVRNSNERKSLFSSFLDVLEARDKQAQQDRQLQEEKYIRRTQKIYDFHERQRTEAVELRRCLDYVSQHAHILESVLRGESGEAAPLAPALARQASALRRCMAQCVHNATRIRHMLAATHQPQMDSLLAKMPEPGAALGRGRDLRNIQADTQNYWEEAELAAWTAFLQRAVDATYQTEVVVDNLHNMIAEQRRYVREVSSSNVFTALCGDSESERRQSESPDRRPASAACSTPINKEP